MDLRKIIGEGITLYHGSKNLFNKFSTSHMGIGSGTKELYGGWGIYLTDARGAAENYGNNVYQVTLTNTNLNLIDFSKPLKKELFVRIITALYKDKHFDTNKINSEYNHDKQVKELRTILWDALKKIDPDLENISPDSMINVANKNFWYYMTNYTKNNKQLQTLFDKYISLTKTKSNNYGFDANGSGFLFYRNLSRILGGDRNASLFLLKNGIDGTKTNVSSTRTDYAIFDVNIIKIEKRL